MYEIFVGLALGLLLGVYSIWWVNKAQRRKQEHFHQELRETACAEREKQIQAAKDNGDFKLWDR